MWHEARRREKATQKLLNEHKKRAERRREENRIDPNSLLQIHGFKSKLCLESGVYKQAVKSLVAWQGDKNITIDRFDVRATLSSIPSARPTSRDSTVLDSEENIFLKKILNYERYRLLIQNDLNKVPEELRLKLVAKSDIASDAKMKKLRNNKFGTSGESFNNNAAAVIFNRHMQVRDQTSKRGGGATIGYNYNSVPPPACLSEGRSDDIARIQDSEHDTTIRGQALRIVDEIDNFQLDGIIISNFEVKKLNEIAKKYGLSGEELTLLARRDKEDVSTAQLLKELVKLNKNKEKAEKELENSANDQVYGPALPPGLKTDQLSSSSEDDDDNNSPVQQRSPSGANIPLRNGSNHDPSEYPQSDDDSKITKVSDEKHTPNSNNSSLQKPVKPKLPSPSLPGQSSSFVQNDTTTKFKYLIEESKDQEKCFLDKQRQNSSDHMSPRRASTPLAYKRNCRSSRSLSRERRHSRHHKSSSHKSSRRNRSRRSRSSSSKSSSPSSYSASSTSKSTSSSLDRRRTSSSSPSSESSRKISKRKDSYPKLRKRAKKKGHRRR